MQCIDLVVHVCSTPTGSMDELTIVAGREETLSHACITQNNHACKEMQFLSYLASQETLCHMHNSNLICSS
jgi:hypothetical protein